MAKVTSKYYRSINHKYDESKITMTFGEEDISNEAPSSLKS